MKQLTFFLVVLLTACSSSKDWDQQAQDQSVAGNYEDRTAHYQDSMSVAFVSGANGVLPKDEVGGTKRLKFYPVSKKYHIPARFEYISNGRAFEMITSTDRLPVYRDFGILHFELDSLQLQLHLYQSVDHPEYLFCPFKDLTNGTETYGAGRYLDFQLKDTLNPVLDFNFCYNPYCAYNYKYSCPIPPEENHLSVRIEAGVKNWK